MFGQRAQDGCAQAVGGGGFVEGIDEDNQRVGAVVEGVEEFTDGVGPNAGGRAEGVQDIGVGQVLGIDRGANEAGGKQAGWQADGGFGDRAVSFGVGEGSDEAEHGGLAGARPGGHHPAR